MTEDTQNPASHFLPDDRSGQPSAQTPPELAALTQYKKLSAATPEEFDSIVDDLKNCVTDEAHGGHYHMNRSMIQQAALLDVAFRYYFSGGETERINRETFVIALKAQQQYMQALRDSRRSSRQQQVDDLKWQEHQAKMRNQTLKNGDILAKLRIKAERNIQKGGSDAAMD